jgi:hypothetical protein
VCVSTLGGQSGPHSLYVVHQRSGGVTHGTGTFAQLQGGAAAVAQVVQRLHERLGPLSQGGTRLQHIGGHSTEVAGCRRIVQRGQGQLHRLFAAILPAVGDLPAFLATLGLQILQLFDELLIDLHQILALVVGRLVAHQQFRVGLLPLLDLRVLLLELLLQLTTALTLTLVELLQLEKADFQVVQLRNTRERERDERQ